MTKPYRARGRQPHVSARRITVLPEVTRCRRQVATLRIRVPHGGARHRRRCCDLVLRFDFDGAWHRPGGMERSS